MTDLSNSRQTLLWLLWSESAPYEAHASSRHEQLPSLQHLDEVFPNLHDEPLCPTQRQGPQYAKSTTTPEPKRNWMASLRAGDRALVVAVNDNGNMGWVRFGRTAFSEYSLM